MDRKFVIVKERGHYKHFKARSDEDHYTIGREKGINHLRDDIVETGIIIEGKIEVWECYIKEHRAHLKITNRWLGNDIDDYLNSLEWWQK